MAFGEIPDSFDAIPERSPEVDAIGQEAFEQLQQCETQIEVADVILQAREKALDANIPYQIIEANLAEKVNSWAAQGASSGVIDMVSWLMT